MPPSPSSIQRAFTQFATPPPPPPPRSSTSTPPAPFLRAGSLPGALAALALALPREREARKLVLGGVDARASGGIAWEDFVAIVARLAERRGREEEEGGEAGEAWGLFVDAGGVEEGEGEGERITLEGLRRVAGGLKIEVADAVLRDMIAEANGLGPGGVGTGVARGEFEGILRRAGALR